MEDEEIVRLFWDRDEQAIAESEKKYGAYCGRIARNILQSPADAEECVNDTWLRAWKAMPPHRPRLLAVFLGKITRNLSFDRYRAETRKRRGGQNIPLVLDELAECVSGREDPEKSWEAKELQAEIGRFLDALPEEKRYMFILRYWWTEDIAAIARRFRTSENNISVQLSRIRKKLRVYLTERGYII